MTFNRIAGCTCARCAGGIGECPDCHSSECARALSHTLMCNRKAEQSHKTRKGRR